MIYEIIKKDIHDEFVKLRTELKIHIEPDSNITQKKKFLKLLIPEEVVHKTEILLDTLINYLIEQARKEIEKADIKFQNKFYEADFRKRINDWTNQLENKLKFDSDMIKYSTDPRLKQGLIAAGITFISGTVITATVFIPEMVVGAIVSGLVTILLSAIAFKIAYDKAAPKSRETVKADIDKYLENAELQMQAWLKSVIEAFSKDFNEFCTLNGFKRVDN